MSEVTPILLGRPRMKHPDHIARYPGSLTDLAVEVGDLRYDVLSAFLAALSAKLGRDADADAARGRLKLATELHNAATAVDRARLRIEEAWRISAPHMGPRGTGPADQGGAGA